MKRTVFFLVVGTVLSNVCSAQDNRFSSGGGYDHQMQLMEQKDAWQRDKKLNGDPKVDLKKLTLPSQANDPDSLDEGAFGDVAYYRFKVVGINEKDIIVKLAKEVYLVKNVDTSRLSLNDFVRLTGPVQYVGEVKKTYEGRERTMRELRLGTMPEYKKWVVESKKKKKPTK